MGPEIGTHSGSVVEPTRHYQQRSKRPVAFRHIGQRGPSSVLLDRAGPRLFISGLLVRRPLFYWDACCSQSYRVQCPFSPYKERPVSEEVAMTLATRFIIMAIARRQALDEFPAQEASCHVKSLSELSVEESLSTQRKGSPFMHSQTSMAVAGREFKFSLKKHRCHEMLCP